MQGCLPTPRGPLRSSGPGNPPNRLAVSSRLYIIGRSNKTGAWRSSWLHEGPRVAVSVVSSHRALRLIVNKIPAHRPYKRPSVLYGNHCGPVLVFTHCLPPPCRLGVRSEGQRPAKIHHKKRLFLPKYFPCTRWHARGGTLAGLERGEGPSLHQLCRLGEDEALST
jgi:hypothetical protein